MQPIADMEDDDDSERSAGMELGVQSARTVVYVPASCWSAFSQLPPWFGWRGIG
jgi:hypothetical protein